MNHSQLTADSIVKAATRGEYAIPEFQREFVWTRSQVMELADSLARDYPVGSLLTWKSKTAIQRGGTTQTQQKSWIIDGQQRTTALCTIFGKRPDWWDYNRADNCNDHVKKYDIQLDVSTDETTFVARRYANSSRFVSVRELLDTDELDEIAQRLARGGEAFTDRAGKIQQHLGNVVNNLKTALMPMVEIDDDVELTEVAEIFKRLNSTGTSVRQADIYLGVLASLNPGWVNEYFLKFMDELAAQEFEIEPAYLFKSFTAIGAKTSRFRNVEPEFWHKPDQNTWRHTTRAWESTANGLKQYGVIGTNFGLSLNALVVASVFREKFPDGPFGPMLAWIILSFKQGYLSGQVETAIDRCISAIDGAASKEEAVVRMFGLLGHQPFSISAFTPEDFLETRSRRNSVQRLMIYLIAYRNDAQDWNPDGYKIRAEATGNYRPEWHHIFPRKWLKDNVVGIGDDLVDSVANMAVISRAANRRISASEPSKYINELDLVSRGLLEQQAIPDPTFVDPEQYESWLKQRAERLAQESNRFIHDMLTRN